MRSRPPLSAEVRLFAARLEVSTQHAATAAAYADAKEQLPSGLWHEIATADAFQAPLVDAVQELPAGEPHHARAPALLEAGVTAVDNWYACVVTTLDDDRLETVLEEPSAILRDVWYICGLAAEVMDDPETPWDPIFTLLP